MTHDITLTTRFGMTDVPEDQQRAILNRVWTQLRNAVTDLRTTIPVPTSLTMERYPIHTDK